MPWLTPDSIPEGDDCRPLSIPADSNWLALVSGALTELTKPYNWQQFGSLTVDETVAKMQEIVDNYYSSPCAMCMTPGSYRVTRISNTGHFEQLDASGSWVPGTDDYYIPPPEARTDGTEVDQICLAAKNAVNVLQQLYENLTDSWNSALDEDEAITAFILGAIALVGFEFAPITWSIVAFMTPVFTALYSALEFIGADLWDTNVSKQIRCFLVDCATNTDGVVTFDYQCFIDNLVSLTNNFSLTEAQTRLYLQISFMLYFIGGMDGLALAGRTTAITDDNCGGCADEWCELLDFTLDPYGFEIFEPYGTYSEGVGFSSVDVGGAYSLIMTIGNLIERVNFVGITVEYENPPSTDPDKVIGLGQYPAPSTFMIVQNFTPVNSPNPNTYTREPVSPEDYDGMYINPNAGLLTGTTNTATVKSLLMRGTGAPPGLGVDCS